MTTENLTADSKALLLLCSALALPRSSDAPKPLSRMEWNDLARSIISSGLERPGKLFGLSSEDMQRELGVSAELADRLASLIDRGGQLSIELERLHSLGIWAVTRADATYPPRLRERLKGHAPPVLFGAGPIPSMSHEGVAIVGSRNVDDAGAAFAAALGERCAAAGLVVFSGGARGVDRLAADGAVAAGGGAVAVLADSLGDALKRRETRQHVLDGHLTLVTPLHPSVKFSVAAAMGRNKIIYGLSSWAVVVAAEAESGGTWAGALENLRAGWAPLFVRDGQGVPGGNRELIARGGRPITIENVSGDLASWLESQSPVVQPELVREAPATYDAPANQGSLFDDEK